MHDDDVYTSQKENSQTILEVEGSAGLDSGAAIADPVGVRIQECVVAVTLAM